MRGSQNFLMCSAVPATAASGPWLAKNLPIWFAMYTSLSGDMGGALRGDASRMREDLEAVDAGDCNKRYSGGLRGAHRECRRRRDGDQHGHAEHGGLLHHLHGDTARQQHQSGRAWNAIAQQYAAELVEGIVAADILPHGEETGARFPECGGMHGARLPVELLS